MSNVVWGVYRRTPHGEWWLVGLTWTYAAAKVVAWNVRRASLTAIETRIARVPTPL